MSVETSKPVEETPVVEKALPEHPETNTTPADTSAAAPHEIPTDFTLGTTEPEGAEEHNNATTTTSTPAAEPAKDETVVDAIPASEGVLGYKEPTLCRS